ncbi:Fur family transcriptional regulator [Cohaesibacter celericrescens]|uniref:Transcriptional repressor n=1 Tax=Cohaesibacter celericrescens TaxID=2067669 RepID=A0A2N5XRL6_9HYPH|nr:Fur family transcriptional regulator [Cohaesibacter celericrescens]PLW77166.1 transcriptional repressor [Cohaesibacter celericrescens]
MAMRGEKMQSEVLGVLQQNLAPLTAYDVLEQLRGFYPKLAPPTIYNALSALTKRGQVHRLESLKAYIACQCDQHSHASIMAICDACGKVEERVASDDLLKTVSSHVDEVGFKPIRHIIEIHGVCASCSSDQGPEMGAMERELLQ